MAISPANDCKHAGAVESTLAAERLCLSGAEGWLRFHALDRRWKHPRPGGRFVDGMIVSLPWRREDVGNREGQRIRHAKHAAERRPRPPTLRPVGFVLNASLKLTRI